ncbi:MAG: HEAT repeat domain-containing protein [Anaerolineales bacterium]|nr:MAG: HEAT repeat domain-containing protein [Anaerolineales bacterium]
MRGYVGVRSMAASALAHIGDPQAVPALKEALADQSLNLQLAALKSLGELECTRALPAIAEFLQANDPRVRRTAALTIGMLKGSAAAPQLLNMARNDASPLVRPAAVEAIGMLGDADMIRYLLPMADDSNAYLRAALAHSLSSLDGESAEVQKVLMKLTGDQVEHVAIAAQRALEKCEQRARDRNAERAACPEPEQKHTSWLRRFLGRT